MAHDAFLMYVDDWLSSGRIDLMDAYEERGYFRLLLRAWKQPDCGLPTDQLTLAAWSRMGTQWFRETADKTLRTAGKTSGQKVLECFVERDGRLFNEKQLTERQYQEKINTARRSNGKLGGRPKKPDWEANNNLEETTRFPTEKLSETNQVSGSVLVLTVSSKENPSEERKDLPMRKEFDDQWLEFVVLCRGFWKDLIEEDLSNLWFGYKNLDFEQKRLANANLSARINAGQDPKFVSRRKYFDQGEWKRVLTRSVPPKSQERRVTSSAIQFIGGGK